MRASEDGLLHGGYRQNLDQSPFIQSCLGIDVILPLPADVSGAALHTLIQALAASETEAGQRMPAQRYRTAFFSPLTTQVDLELSSSYIDR